MANYTIVVSHPHHRNYIPEYGVYDAEHPVVFRYEYLSYKEAKKHFRGFEKVFNFSECLATAVHFKHGHKLLRGLWK